MHDPFLVSLASGEPVPPAVRHLHSGSGAYVGRCRIERGERGVVSLLLRLGGFPAASEDAPVSLEVVSQEKNWIWERKFDTHLTRSQLTYDPRLDCVNERIGALSIWLKPVMRGEKLSIDILRLHVLGVPCPRFLLPRSNTVEWQDDEGRFRFDVSADVPGLGMLIRYRGWLSPVHAELVDV